MQMLNKQSIKTNQQTVLERWAQDQEMWSAQQSNKGGVGNRKSSKKTVFKSRIFMGFSITVYFVTTDKLNESVNCFSALPGNDKDSWECKVKTTQCAQQVKTHNLQWHWEVCEGYKCICLYLSSEFILKHNLI